MFFRLSLVALTAACLFATFPVAVAAPVAVLNCFFWLDGDLTADE